ncbi:hypothetical protein HDU93_006513 [Gonapodya sp. JEL0774]|nr:hypothetical protein HDU93_006513 [Gonapodya sp. JEL0774]
MGTFEIPPPTIRPSQALASIRALADATTAVTSSFIWGSPKECPSWGARELFIYKLYSGILTYGKVMGVSDRVHVQEANKSLEPEAASGLSKLFGWPDPLQPGTKVTEVSIPRVDLPYFTPSKTDAPMKMEVIEWTGSVPPARVNGCEGMVIVYFFGGGYVVGTAASARVQTVELARVTGCTVYCPEYRVACYGQHPAQIHDGYSTIRYLTDKAPKGLGISPNKIILSGWSAGGNLAMNLSRFLVEQEFALKPAGVVPFAPVTDFTASCPSRWLHTLDIIPPLERLGHMAPIQWVAHLKNEELTDPLVSPLFASPRADLPPMLIEAGSVERLYDEALLCALRYSEKSPIVGVTMEETTHVWYGAFQPQYARLMQTVGEFIARVNQDPKAIKSEFIAIDAKGVSKPMSVADIKKYLAGRMVELQNKRDAFAVDWQLSKKFLDIIHPLTHPPSPTAPAFHVVVPSLVGYGFSSAATVRDFGVVENANVLNVVMKTLGYHRYIAQGGDWGAFITKALAVVHPESCKAIHLNFPIFSRPPKDANVEPPTPAEHARIVNYKAGFERSGTGYQRIQETKPQTLGFALSDSPIGLMAWIGEKFHEIVDLRGGDGDFSPSISLDHLLTNIMIYYISNCITSSVRLYRYQFFLGIDDGLMNTSRIFQPVGVAAFPYEIFVAPKSWVNYWCPNLIHWTEFKTGGHFAAMEQSSHLVEDIRKFATVKVGLHREEVLKRRNSDTVFVVGSAVRFIILKTLITEKEGIPACVREPSRLLSAQDWKSEERKPTESTALLHTENMVTPTPFRVSCPPYLLATLKERLRNARFPENSLANPIGGGDTWEYGMPNRVAKRLVEHWLNKYDWAIWERRINEFNHFKLDVAVPVGAAKGDPRGNGSVSFLDIIRPLTHPPSPTAPAFHVVVPSLVGYGFSSAATVRDFGVVEVSKVFNEVMKNLGYNSYGAWCSTLNMPTFPRPPKDANVVPPTAAEQERIDKYVNNFSNAGTGYQRIQATKPQTLGFSVSDSPVGLMAWIGEKFLDAQLLSSVKFDIPVGCAAFPHEIFVPPRGWAEYWCPKLVQWSVFERGGHFAALERPADLIGDIRKFVTNKLVQRALSSERL